MYDALGKGDDPDRMKGALYILWNKGIGKCGCANHDNVTKSFLHTAAYALTGMFLLSDGYNVLTIILIDQSLHSRYLLSLLGCQDEEKVRLLVTCHMVPAYVSIVSPRYRSLCPV